jgi:hypothetical protein
MKKSIGFLYWLPRVLCIAAILFVSIFALDAFSTKQTIWQNIGDFTIHLVPSFILLLILIIAWKYELTGGIIFTVTGIFMTPFIYNHNRSINHFSIAESINVVLLITFPFIVIGVLFILSHFKKARSGEISH